MYIPQTSALQKNMDISGTPLVWMPPRSQLTEISEESADNGSVLYTRTTPGYGAPAGGSPAALQTNSSSASIFKKPPMSITGETRAITVTGAQAAKDAAKGEAWARMRSEYWAVQTNGTDADSIEASL